MRLDGFATGHVDPGVAPCAQVLGGFPVQDLDELGPGGVAESERSQVFLHALVEAVFADQFLEFAHHDRRLVVNDRAVHLAGFIQVFQVLADGVGARRTIYGVSARIVAHEEIQVVIDVRELRVDNLRGHEIREDFFRPDVVEPLHGHQVAEPHMCRLMRDQRCAAKQLGIGRRFLEEQVRCAVQDGANMLHTSVLEIGDQREAELVVRVVDAGVLLEPVE